MKKSILGLAAAILALVLASAALVSCQDRSPRTWHYEAPPVSTAGGGTNSQQTSTPPVAKPGVNEWGDKAVAELSDTPPPSNSIAFQETKARAEKGDAAAQTKLAQMYAYGIGVAKDEAEAVKWERKAAEQGDAVAQDGLAYDYDSGQGVDKDQAESVKWRQRALESYRKAAESGNANAQSELGMRYHFGLWGVPQDYAQAANWLRKAAEQDNSNAQLLLAIMFRDGRGVPQDYVEAYKWLTLGTATVPTETEHTKAAQLLSELEKNMTPTQIEEGQRLAREFVARKEGEVSNPTDGQGSNVVGNLPRFTGTGFFVTDDGSLLTAFHVVQDAGRIAVRTKAGTLAAMLVKADKANDVALLKVTGKFSALPVASSRGVKLGESVFTIGFPNIELQGFAPKLTKGEINSLTGVQDDPREFQISVAVQPGNSGGPLVNQYGNVVGIVEARLADVSTLETTGALPQNVNYAMKSSVLNALLESLPEVSAKLKEPNPSKDRKFEDVEKEAESAVALVLVY